MNIEQLIFKILQKDCHTWVRYSLTEKMDGTRMPGEYIEIRSGYMPGSTLNELLLMGFKIDLIKTQKINADSFSDILLKREIEDCR